MEKERKVKVLSLVTLVVAVLGLTIAFAALSQSLKVNGRTEIERAEFNVHFDNLSTDITGDAKVIKMPDISSDGTTLSNFEISLTKPGDKIVFNYDIVNQGEIVVQVDSLYFNGVKVISGWKIPVDDLFIEADIDGDGVTTEEEKVEAFEMFDFLIADLNGSWGRIEPGEIGKGAYLSVKFVGDKLPKGNVRLKINVEYKYIQI